MTQAAEHARKAAAASLKDAVRELNRYKEKPPLNKRLLQKKLEKVLNYKDDLVDLEMTSTTGLLKSLGQTWIQPTC